MSAPTNPPPRIVRNATEADLPTLVEFQANLALHVSGSPPLALKEAEYDRLVHALRTALYSPDKCILVAEQTGGGIVGMGTISIWCSPSIWEQATETEHRSGIIDDIWVEPAFRNAGFFKAMLRKLVDFADRQGAEELILEYAASNREARAAWTQLGFVTTGVRAAAFTHQVKKALA